MIKIKTGIREAFNGGHQAWFKIDNQTFYLQECEADEVTTSKEVAEWYEGCLKTAFEKLDEPKQEEGETELQKVMNELGKWQVETFPSANSLSKLHHLKEEVVELIEAKDSSAISCPGNVYVRREYADCFMLLLGAAIKDGFTANNIIEAMREKHEINKKRKWGKPDKNGVVKHI